MAAIEGAGSPIVRLASIILLENEADLVDFAAIGRGVREIRRRSFGSLVLARGKESEGGRSVRIGGLEREGLSGEEIQAGGSVWPVSVGWREKIPKVGGGL